MTMQNPFGPAFGNAGLQLPNPNAPPPPPKLLSPEESEAAGIQALQQSTVNPLQLATGGALSPTTIDAAKARAAQAMPPAAVPVAAAAPAAPTISPEVVAKAKARAGGGAPKGPKAPTLQEQYLDAMKANTDADVAGVRAQQTHQAMLGDLIDQQRDQAEQRMIERQARQAERDRQIDQQMGQLSQDVDAVKNIRFDANRVFASPAGILGAAASAMRAGANERIMGRNLAEDSLRDAINRDFEEQKANAAQKTTALGAKQNFITMMRQNYQDRDQADAAAEIAHKEAAIQQIAALAAHSKVPELQAQADKLVAGLQGDVVKMRMQWKAQADAKAAAAANQMWERYKWEREQRRKEAETMSVIDKNGAEKTSKLDEETSKLGAQLTSAKIPAALASAERASADLREGGTLLNSNPVANSFAQAMPLTYKLLAGDKAQRSQMSFANFKNEILNQKGGAAISDSELARHLQDLEGAGTPEDKLIAINNVVEALKRGEAAIKAGASPQAAAEYDRRQRALAPTVSTSAPPGFIAGGGQ